MALPDYQLVVVDPLTGSTRYVFDGVAIDELKYNRPLNDVGALALTLPGDAAWPSVFELDSMVEVLRVSPLTGQFQVEDTFLTRMTQRFQEGGKEHYVVGALSLNHLLTRRVIDPDDDPLGVGGYSTKAGLADDVMRSYAREQMGDLASAVRQLPNFSVGPSQSIGRPVGKRSRYDNLFTVFQELARQGGIDFIVQRLTGNTLRLTLAPIGTDKSKTAHYPFGPFVMFNPARGNLSDPSLVIDRNDEKNFCYALGQGQGEARIVAKVTGLGIGDSPYNRIEFKEDIRLAERGQSAQLLTGARDALTEHQAAREFSFKPTGQEPGAIYRADFDIGDVITAQWDDESVDLRVTDVEITISESGESIEIRLEPRVNAT